MMPWDYGKYAAAPEPPRGTRCWRAYFKDRSSFTFGLYFERTAEDAAKHAAQWGEVIAVEPVT